MMRFERSVTGRIRETIGGIPVRYSRQRGGLVDTGGQAESLLGTETTIAHSGCRGTNPQSGKTDFPLQVRIPRGLRPPVIEPLSFFVRADVLGCNLADLAPCWRFDRWFATHMNQPGIRTRQVVPRFISSNPMSMIRSTCLPSNLPSRASAASRRARPIDPHRRQRGNVWAAKLRSPNPTMARSVGTDSPRALRFYEDAVSKGVRTAEKRSRQRTPRSKSRASLRAPSEMRTGRAPAPSACRSSVFRQDGLKRGSPDLRTRIHPPTPRRNGGALSRQGAPPRLGRPSHGKADQHIHRVGVRSHTSTTGIFAATRRRRLSAEWEMPVRKMPSGRRLMMAVRRLSSLEVGLSDVPSSTWYPLSHNRSVRDCRDSENTC